MSSSSSSKSASSSSSALPAGVKRKHGVSEDADPIASPKAETKPKVKKAKAEGLSGDAKKLNSALTQARFKVQTLRTAHGRVQKMMDSLQQLCDINQSEAEELKAQRLELEDAAVVTARAVALNAQAERLADDVRAREQRLTETSEEIKIANNNTALEMASLQKEKQDLSVEQQRLKRDRQQYSDCLLYTSPSPRDS